MSAPVAAPCVKPSTSGLPSGLRTSDWKTAPASASAAPTSRAVTTRGSRSSLTMNSLGRVPRAGERAQHVGAGIGKSPLPMRDATADGHGGDAATTAPTPASAARAAGTTTRAARRAVRMTLTAAPPSGARTR